MGISLDTKLFEYRAKQDMCIWRYIESRVWCGKRYIESRGGKRRDLLITYSAWTDQAQRSTEQTWTSVHHRVTIRIKQIRDVLNVRALMIGFTDLFKPWKELRRRSVLLPNLLAHYYDHAHSWFALAKETLNSNVSAGPMKGKNPLKPIHDNCMRYYYW